MRELRQRGELPATKEGLTIELAMRAADLLASAGAGANDTVMVMRRICAAYGLQRAQLDVTSNVILASYYPGEGMPPITSMRTVSQVVPNLSKVYGVNDLVAQVTNGLSLGRAMRRFDGIRKGREPYPPWLAALAAGGVSMGVQLLYATSWIMLPLGLITGYLVNRFVYLLSRRGLPALFQQMFGGWLIVAFAAGFTWLNSHPAVNVLGYVSPTAIAVGCVFQLVVGARFVAGIQDAIDAFFVTAAARMVQVVLMTAGLVVGLVSGLDLARRLGVDVYISASVPPFGSAPGQVVGATATAVFTAMSYFANRRTLAVTAVTTALGWGAYLIALNLGWGAITANFVGPMVAAFFVTLLVRRLWQIPAFGVINAMGIPFVPGLGLYLGLIQMVGSASAPADPSTGGATLGTAAAIALAIAAGASLGVLLGRPVSEQLMLIPHSWKQRRAKRKRRKAAA
jgi:uncharacterized membrane protein YjjP (DUF1212 family)/uncharacterized membrane protein YjjB (DUF3815 family)